MTEPLTPLQALALNLLRKHGWTDPAALAGDLGTSSGPTVSRAYETVAKHLLTALVRKGLAVRRGEDDTYRPVPPPK